jgi:hypothetical protein
MGHKVRHITGHNADYFSILDILLLRLFLIFEQTQIKSTTSSDYHYPFELCRSKCRSLYIYIYISLTMSVKSRSLYRA